MNNTLSISFSDTNFQLLFASSRDSAFKIQSAQSYYYPSIKSLDQLLSSENIDFILSVIKQFKEDSGITDMSISFTLPFNYAEVKNILLPSKCSTELKKQQIQWEISSTIANDLNLYKISLMKEIEKENHIQTIVVAIKKEILKKLQSIAQNIQADISNVILNCFALEKVLLSQKGFSFDKNYVLLKIENNYLEYHFFNGNKYLLSQIDLLDNLTRTKEELIVEITNERNKNISNFIDKESGNYPLELIIYGSSATEEVFEALRKGISTKVSYATIENFPSSDDFKYIESWGSFL